ncbi:hypothetical protein Mkiyose1665_14900 [Mycobacterium kiyosense]|uniref:Uncharacterized protein n=1 Tax=Mycobacterium kiyosense TaxID=2871094 RepID=A0A9P3Q6X7_9MYCO|nr:hypothetical protein MKCMC460_25940 [Mycobacterium sp. 20KCMC460]GLB85503.1 hypothetical protein SRL2020028_47590 [Mycobacterium kiyosense]GLB89022.1 hypothetical protein SRL2020130_18390 [Mycobacterium kiyosense]GLB94374.1 hypothetical protein SRL2020226_11500 [Mycobacterium kiyosense]GLC00946.1 hypothetical protein SRL2020400_15370 [Mycobacterium kiyosense]
MLTATYDMSDLRSLGDQRIVTLIEAVESIPDQVFFGGHTGRRGGGRQGARWVSTDSGAIAVCLVP